MNDLFFQLDKYAARNTEIALRVLQSDQNEYAFSNLITDPHHSQVENQPAIQDQIPYIPHSHSAFPPGVINAFQQHISPYPIEEFSDPSCIYSDTWSQTAMGQIDGSNILTTLGDDSILGHPVELRQEFQTDDTTSCGLLGQPRALDEQWLVTDNYGLELITQNRCAENQRMYYTEEPKIRGRGRPRVNPKDETTAERRRTQIRLAQRAYRQRQDSTISSLERKAQGLLDVKEEMGNIMDDLYSNAVCIGLLQREPEFSELLQTTAEKFSTLAKTPANEDETETKEVKSC